MFPPLHSTEVLSATRLCVSADAESFQGFSFTDPHISQCHYTAQSRHWLPLLSSTFARLIQTVAHSVRLIVPSRRCVVFHYTNFLQLIRGHGAWLLHRFQVAVMSCIVRSTKARVPLCAAKVRLSVGVSQGKGLVVNGTPV